MCLSVCFSGMCQNKAVVRRNQYFRGQVVAISTFRNYEAGNPRKRCRFGRGGGDQTRDPCLVRFHPSDKEFGSIDWTSVQLQSKTDHFYVGFSQLSQVRPFESLLESGAGDGNRTHVRSLGSFYTAIVRRPLVESNYTAEFNFCAAPRVGLRLVQTVTGANPENQEDRLFLGQNTSKEQFIRYGRRRFLAGYRPRSTGQCGNQPSRVRVTRRIEDHISRVTFDDLPFA
jgi:hypothetical protein